MEASLIDRVLHCADCHGEFIFTAGEQLFFLDKQFKNDPKRCKPCKSRRSGLAAAANGASPLSAGMVPARTETRTECSDCGVETTVPFKPTQGRPVLCRQCFQAKGRAGASTQVAGAQAATALAGISLDAQGAVLSTDAAVLAVASMAGAPPDSSVASMADLASVADLPAHAEWTQPDTYTPLATLEKSPVLLALDHSDSALAALSLEADSCGRLTH